MKINIKKNDSNIKIVYWAIAYTIMHGGLLLASNAVFWDDWLVYRSSDSVIFQTFSEAGSILNWVSYLHIFMLAIGVWSYKLFTFFLMFGAGLLLAFILERNSLIPKSLRFTLVLLFLILPFNFARIAAIDFPYALCYFSFFLAWALIDRSRVMAAGLFLLSFNTNSLLVFYFLPILDLLYRTCRPLDLRSAMKFPLRRPELMILPFAFFYTKIKFFKPSGDYDGYNQNFKLKHIFNAAKEQFFDIGTIELNWPIFSLLLLGAFYAIIKNSAYISDKISLRTSVFIFCGGIFVFLLAVLPYWILDLVPTFYEWASRHQLLMPLGTSMIIVGFIWLFPRPLRVLGTSVVVAGSLSLGVVNYSQFWLDWQKQKMLVKLFAASDDIRKADVLLIDDQTLNLNAIKREYRFYEWNGLLEEAFGNQSRFAVSADKSKWYFEKEANRFASEMYKAGAHKFKESPQTVAVKIIQIPSTCEEICLLPNLTPKLAITTAMMDGNKP